MKDTCARTKIVQLIHRYQSHTEKRLFDTKAYFDYSVETHTLHTHTHREHTTMHTHTLYIHIIFGAYGTPAWWDFGAVPNLRPMSVA